MTGLVNEERNPKVERLLPEIGQGIMITRDKQTGDVNLTKMCRKDVFMMVSPIAVYIPSVRCAIYTSSSLKLPALLYLLPSNIPSSP